MILILKQFFSIVSSSVAMVFLHLY